MALAQQPTLLSSLDALPYELLLEIFDHLGAIRGIHLEPDAEAARREENLLRKRSLYSALFTSRQFHSLAQPVLYQSYIHSEHDPIAIHQFKRAICTNPNLARYIRYIEVLHVTKHIPGCVYPALNDDFLVATDQLVREKVEGVINKLDLHEPWTNSLTICTEFHLRETDCAIGTIILLAPNLVDVVVGEYSLFINTMLSVKQQFGVVREFRNSWFRGELKYGDTHPGPVDISMIPTTRNLSLVNSPVEITKNGSMLGYPHSFATNEVILDKCDVGPAQLEELLKGCSSLRRFTCRWESNAISGEDHQASSQEINLPDLGLALAYHHNTLEYLVLDTLESGWLVPIDQNIPAIGSLRHFTKLKHLDASGFVLWGDSDEGHGDESLASLLPPSLESLIIRTEWDDDVHWSLMVLAEDREALLPRLKVVNCSWRPAPRGPETSKLRDQFMAAGLELQIEEYDIIM